MVNAFRSVGLWEWEPGEWTPGSQQDWVDDQLAEFLQANGLIHGGSSSPLSLLTLLGDQDRERLLGAARQAWETQSLLDETLELPGPAGSTQKLRLSGSSLPSGRSARIVAACSLEIHPPAAGDAELRDFLKNDLIDSIPLLIVALNQAGELHYVNRRVEELLGYSLNELKEMDWVTTFLDPSEQARITATMARAYQGQVMEPIQTRIRSATDELRLVEWSHCASFPCRSPAGWMLGVGVDVTEREHSERDLRFKQRALEQSINGIFVADVDSRLTYTNDSALRSLGYTAPAEIAGRSVLEFCADQSLGSQVLQTLLTEDAWVGEMTLIRKDGSLIEMLISATVVRDPDGQAQSMMASTIDVTERKRQNDALRTSEASLKLSQSYLRAIFDSSPDCIKVVDKDCRLIDMNQAGIRALEVDSLEQIRGMDICECIAPEDREPYRRAVQTACAGGRSTAEFQMISAQGTRRWMEQHAVGLACPQGSTSPEQMVSVTQDVTERMQIQAALKQSEQHYRKLFETMSEGFALHELIVNDQGEPVDYRYLDVNPAFETLMSRKRAEVVNRCHSEFPSDDREFWVKAYGHVVLSGEPLRLEYVHPKSKRQWIVLAYRTEGRQFAVLFSDISNWRQAEQERRSMHDRLMMIINNAPLIMFSLDRDGRVTASEGKGLARVGLRPGQLVGKTIAEVYPDAAPSLAAIRRAFSGESVSFLAEGQGVFFDSHYEPHFDQDGQVIGMTGLAIDMTEQTRTQSALRESEERLQLFLKYAPAGVAMFDRDLKYIAYSGRWLVDHRLVGQDLLGRSHYEVFPEIPARWREIHRRCLQGAVERCERDLFERADGTATWLRWEIQPWHDADGKIGGLVLFTEDVSKDVQAEEEVQSLRNQAAHAGRVATMGEMAAGIAHELNQPLAAINLYAEGSVSAAKSGALTQVELIEKFAEIGALANRCGEIIRRLRAFATKRETRRMTVDLREIIAASSELLRHEYRNASVHCRVTVPEEPLWLIADTIELQQVFINILRNALEATIANPDSEPLVEVIVARISPEQCRVTVRDRGVGIPPEQLAQLFTPFFTTKANGLGMGLKICATIVRAHRGEIECKPVTGGGTEFLILLPLVQPRP